MPSEASPGIDHAIHDERIALHFRALIRADLAGAIRPRRGQFVNITRVDLRERGIVAALLVAEIGRPVGISRSGWGRCSSQQNGGSLQSDVAA